MIGKRQVLFDLWGDTAARITAGAGVDAVFISAPLWSGRQHRCRARSQGLFGRKGKGRLDLVEGDGVD